MNSKIYKTRQLYDCNIPIQFAQTEEREREGRERERLDEGIFTIKVLFYISFCFIGTFVQIDTYS